MPSFVSASFSLGSGAPKREAWPERRSAALAAPSLRAPSMVASTAPRLWPLSSKEPALIRASQQSFPTSCGSRASAMVCRSRGMPSSCKFARPLMSSPIAFFPVPLIAPNPKRIALGPSGMNSHCEWVMEGGRISSLRLRHSLSRALILSESPISQEKLAARNAVRWFALRYAVW